METLRVDKATTAEAIEAFQSRRCGQCGRAAREHTHLFGSQNYLCPTVSVFTEPRQQKPPRCTVDGVCDDDPRCTECKPDEASEFPGWVPEFTVYLVRRGKQFPMIVDSVFVDEAVANKRLSLFPRDQGWHVMRYSHIRPPTVEPQEEKP
jgi:hypothetical protein